jgi:trimethylamine--corrinoid protein Co-methyltransferase
MDMRSTLYSYGAPELALMGSALTEICHNYYRLPMFGVTGSTDAGVIDFQAGAEVTYEILVAALSGVDLVRSASGVYSLKVGSPEMIVLGDEIVGMANILLGGIEIDEETLALDLIEKIGPKSSYIAESHTLKHFRKFWVPDIFSRSFFGKEGGKHSSELLKDRTIKILENHQPKPLPENLVDELRNKERTWFESVGLKYEYPKKPNS